jgi:hypothetical protein
MNEGNQLSLIDRVDLREVPTGVLVQSFEIGWRTTNTASESHLNYSTPLADMVAWFKDRGWTVLEWPGGARAFRGQPRPVRDAGSARREEQIHATDTRLKGARLNWQLEG